MLFRSDWLSHHNPSIDWFQGTLHFDRCPGQCGFREEDLEKEEPRDEAQKWLASIVPDRPSWVEERVTQRYLDRFKGLFSEKGSTGYLKDVHGTTQLS